MDVKIIDELDTFFSQFRKYTYKPGEILVHADEDPSGIMYLKKGNVKQYAISHKGDELVLNIFKPVSFFPMSWAMNGTPNQYYFEALSEVEIWKAPREQVVAFIKAHPEIMFDLLRRVYLGTDGMLMRMTYLMSGNAYTRLITELLIHTKRFGKKNESDTTITLNYTESELATSAGMTRETVSREMKNLKDKGLVTLMKNTIVIQDISRLEAELQTDY